MSALPDALLAALVAEFKKVADRNLIKTRYCPAYRAAKEYVKGKGYGTKAVSSNMP